MKVLESAAFAETAEDIGARIDALDWAGLEAQLDGYGCATASSLLSRDECEALAASYERDALFRSRVVMERHGFGRGEYKYFAYPLPDVLERVRSAAYPYLAPIANRWNEVMRIETRYPREHAAFIERCHRAGQTRPTPLLLRYVPGDFNCLHQDLYG